MPFNNYTCGRIPHMGDIVKYTSPYLYPFVIEYSFIAAAVLLAMWKNIGKNPRYVYHKLMQLLMLELPTKSINLRSL